TDEAIERHRGDMADDRTPLPTEAPMGGQQGVAGDVGRHRAVAQDDRRQDGEDRFTPRTLDAPEGETAQPDPAVIGVARPPPPPPPRGRGWWLSAAGGEGGEGTVRTRPAIATHRRR